MYITKEIMMQKKITFRHMEHTPILDSYINEQLAKLEEFLSHERDPIILEVVVEPHDLHAHHRASVLIKSPRFEVFVDKFGADMYQVISTAIDDAYEMLCKQKEKYVHDDKRGMQHSGEVPELLEKKYKDIASESEAELLEEDEEIE
jgi:ribosomal subunit interface protein